MTWSMEELFSLTILFTRQLGCHQATEQGTKLICRGTGTPRRGVYVMASNIHSSEMGQKKQQGSPGPTVVDLLAVTGLNPAPL